MSCGWTGWTGCKARGYADVLDEVSESERREIRIPRTARRIEIEIALKKSLQILGGVIIQKDWLRSEDREEKKRARRKRMDCRRDKWCKGEFLERRVKERLEEHLPHFQV